MSRAATGLAAGVSFGFSDRGLFWIPAVFLIPAAVIGAIGLR